MAIRINQAKNFKGKAYVAADELDNLIKSMEFATALTGSSNDAWKVNFQYADQTGTATETAVDLTAIKEYIDNHGISLTSTDSSITITNGEGVTKNLATNLYVKKVDTNTGYAATYQLQIGNGSGATAIGDQINIVKDQFIKSATMGWATDPASITTDNWQAGQDSTHKYPAIKIEVWTNIDGADDSSSQGEVTTLFVPLNSVFADKTAGNGIDADQLASNVIAVKIDTTTDARTIITTSGAAGTDLIAATASGIVVGDVQAAIDVAVDDEHAKAGAAITALDERIDDLQGKTSAAVGALNTAVTSTAAAVTALDSKVDAAFVDADTKIESAIDAVVSNVNTALDTTVSTIDANISGAVASLNTRIETVAGNAQTAVQTVGSAVDALDTKVDGAFATLESNVNATIDAVESTVTAHTANAVQILSTTVTMTQADNATSAIGNVASALHIIGVFDSDSNQIYPEIIKSGSGYNFVAEFTSGVATSETWTVYYTTTLTAYGDHHTVTTNGYAADTDVDGTTVASGTPATVTSSNETAADAVDADDISYANATTVTVTGGTAPAAYQSDIAIGNLTYDTVAP